MYSLSFINRLVISSFLNILGNTKKLYGSFIISTPARRQFGPPPPDWSRDILFSRIPHFSRVGLAS